MAVRRQISVTFGHVTNVRQEGSLLGNQVKTTTTYRPTVVHRPRSPHGEDAVPVECGYPGCGKTVVVRVSGIAEARRERRSTLLIALALAVAVVLDLVLLRAYVADAVGFLFILLLLPLLAATGIATAAGVGHVGRQRGEKVSGHLIKIR